MALGIVELLDRAHQADIAFLHQIHHRQAIRGILLGDRDNQAQVSLDQMLACIVAAIDLLLQRKALAPRLIPFAIKAAARIVARFHRLGQRHFLLGRKQRHLADLLQVHAHRIIKRDIGQVRQFRQKLVLGGRAICDFSRRLNHPNALGLEGRVELIHVRNVVLWLGERLENVAVGEIALCAGDPKQLL